MRDTHLEAYCAGLMLDMFVDSLANHWFTPGPGIIARVREIQAQFGGAKDFREVADEDLEPLAVCLDWLKINVDNFNSKFKD